MKLTLVRIEWFRSVKQALDLHIDPAITILIGANDHGKTNLLKAILALNRERPLSLEDQNWDSSENDSLRITHRFTLDEEEREVVRVLGSEPVTREPDAPGVQSDSSAVPPPKSAKIRPVVPKQVDFVQGADMAEPILTFDVELPEPEFPGLRSYLLRRLPRVELFESVRQLTDVVTLSEIEDQSQEFMQGIFRYAGIWDRRARLFQQNPATARELERASEAFTSRIRAEWHQGENLTFKFLHAGQNGSQIELLIRDPSVANRFVRPSERSAGFSAFFEMSMRLRARTESHKAQTYIFLFDEPGTALHPSGQVNLQRVFERLAQDNQIVYATHSLFMISHNRPERSRVVSKGESGTQLDEKPYLRNWRAVRDSLGLILTGNFFIADTTLLVEGASDAMYIGCLLAFFDRVGAIDVDLNLFSVQWPGNVQDFEPTARLMLEEGRRVVALSDGDGSGKEVRRRLGKLNEAVTRGEIQAREPVEILQLESAESIEDVLPFREEYFHVIIKAAKELVGDGFRAVGVGRELNTEELLKELNVEKQNKTLGKHAELVTKTWFEDKTPISKVMIARNYCAWLEASAKATGPRPECPAILRKLANALRLEQKLGEKAVLARATNKPLLASLIIESAHYGAAGKFVDVTATLAQRVDTAGSLRVVADNQLAGDPSPGTPKEMSVVYLHKGRRLAMSVKEGDVVALP